MKTFSNTFNGNWSFYITSCKQDTDVNTMMQNSEMMKDKGMDMKNMKMMKNSDKT